MANTKLEIPALIFQENIFCSSDTRYFLKIISSITGTHVMLPIKLKRLAERAIFSNGGTPKKWLAADVTIHEEPTNNAKLKTNKPQFRLFF
ncbi:hypothetical protein [Enterococcus sp. AZ051]|uniref:hypothetical protein n=1 Tax=Enterococcus sp. AZ051 TaxID=2774698 RepID=UPI003D2C3BE8